jgi:hypothetical protein
VVPTESAYAGRPYKVNDRAMSRWTWGASLGIEIMAMKDDLIDDPPSTRARAGI